MPWWGWIAVGALLLVAELTFVDLEFYLVFLGLSALITGALELAGLTLPFWMQWLVFGGLAIVSLVIFRRQLYKVLRPAADDDVRVGVEGARAIANDAIAPGATGIVSLRGANWTGINRGTTTISAAAYCRVIRSEGLTLDIEPEA
jgi:membrane protein implicated in regulation of membrane protease activity